jgi:hypothetical protein
MKNLTKKSKTIIIINYKFLRDPDLPIYLESGSDFY